MLYSQARGRKVVSTTSAETVGKVTDFLVDPQTWSVAALHVKKAPAGNTLPWVNLTGFGEDAVTVGDADAIVAEDAEAKALARKDHRLVKKRTLTTSGDEIGVVSDVEFDPATGAVTALLLGKDKVRVEGDRLVGVGSYAVVVSSP